MYVLLQPRRSPLPLPLRQDRSGYPAEALGAEHMQHTHTHARISSWPHRARGTCSDYCFPTRYEPEVLSRRSRSPARRPSERAVGDAGCGGLSLSRCLLGKRLRPVVTVLRPRKRAAVLHPVGRTKPVTCPSGNPDRDRARSLAPAAARVADLKICLAFSALGGRSLTPPWCYETPVQCPAACVCR